MTILENSFLAHLFWPLQSELQWFLALGEGGRMLLPTLLAIAGSSAAWAANYGTGRLVALLRMDELGGEDGYRKAQRIAGKYLAWLLLLPWLPFMGMLPLALGALRVPAVTVLSLALVGRCLYYAWYLIT